MECAGRALSFWSYQMVQDLFVALPPGPGRLGLPYRITLTSMIPQNLGEPPLQSLDGPT